VFCKHNYVYTQGHFYCTKCHKRTHKEKYGKRHGTKIGRGLKLKIWMKVMIAGVIVFFAGSFIIANYGGLNSVNGIYGMGVVVIGGALFVVGLIAGLTRGYRRMMGE